MRVSGISVTSLLQAYMGQHWNQNIFRNTTGHWYQYYDINTPETNKKKMLHQNM